MDSKILKAFAIAILSAMALAFLGITVYVSLRNIARSGGEGSTYVASQQEESLEEIEYKEVDVSDQIYTVSDVDESVDDVAFHDFEVESSFVNTIDLLPSIYEQREKVYKEKVDTSEFPDSYALASSKSMEVAGATISVPTEVYLYNSGTGKSSELEVEAEITGDDSKIKNIGWASTNPTVLAVEDTAGSKTKVYVKDTSFSGRVPVSLIITYSKKAGKTETAEMELDVVVEEISYGNEELKDKDGNALFLDLEGNEIARVSDFGSSDYFYGAIKTTGWQDIDGGRYYFDSKSMPVTGRQIIGGLPYEFAPNGMLKSSNLEMGIDVSKYQKDIDWEQVAASGVSFAIIRCGFRGSVSGKLVEDQYFYKNVEGATRNGIAVGVYFFTQAITEQEAIEEASMAIEMCRGYNISLPIYIDTEGAPSGRANNIPRDTRTACMRAFCETINHAGYTGGVYASKSWFYHQLNASALEQYSIWVAQYNTECNYTGKTDFWQYSSKETIAGIVGYVDVDVVRRNY